MPNDWEDWNPPPEEPPELPPEEPQDLGGPAGGGGWDPYSWLPSIGEAPTRSWNEMRGGAPWDVEEYGPGNFRWRMTPDVPKVAPAPMNEFQGWAQDFEQQHGRRAEEKDFQDKQWMDSFVQQSGRLPTRDDWVRHWYSQPAGRRNYAPEFAPYTNIGGKGGWDMPTAPILWPQGMDKWNAFETLGLQGQRKNPADRALYNYSQRLIATTGDWAEWKSKADAIVDYLRARRKNAPPEEKEEQEKPVGGTAPTKQMPAGLVAPALGLQGEFIDQRTGGGGRTPPVGPTAAELTVPEYNQYGVTGALQPGGGPSPRSTQYNYPANYPGDNPANYGAAPGGMSPLEALQQRWAQMQGQWRTGGALPPTPPPSGYYPQRRQPPMPWENLWNQISPYQGYPFGPKPPAAQWRR